MAIKKNLRTFSITLIVAMLLTMSACTENETLKNIEDCYRIRTNGDLTYSYEIMNLKGKVIYSESSVVKAPTIKPLSSSVLEASSQAGTGLSTNWAVFCDVENGIVSETFHYVLLAQGNYVIYVDYENGEHSIIAQNIFDKSEYYKEHVLTNCSPVAADVVIDAKPTGKGVAVVTYLTGEDYKETELTIKFP